MRGRSAALAIAGVLLLAGMVALRCSLASTDVTPAPPSRTQASGTPVEPAPASSTPAAPAAPVTPPPAPTGPAPTAAPVAPELPAPAPPVAPTEKHPPIANKAQLREQVMYLEDAVNACGKAAGAKADGTAVLTLLVSPDKKKQQVTIEQTGVEYDGTTITDQPLLDCLKDTSKAMQFKFVPDSDGVFALRRVKFEHGTLTENVFVDFHYVR